MVVPGPEQGRVLSRSKEVCLQGTSWQKRQPYFQRHSLYQACFPLVVTLDLGQLSKWSSVLPICNLQCNPKFFCSRPQVQEYPLLSPGLFCWGCPGWLHLCSTPSPSTGETMSGEGRVGEGGSLVLEAQTSHHPPPQLFGTGVAALPGCRKVTYV